MPLINCKGNLKLKWKKKYYVLAGAGVDNVNTNDNNFSLIIKDTKLFPQLFYHQIRFKNCQSFLSKGLYKSR